MNDTVITAIISGLCVAIPSVIATYFQNQATIKVMSYRLGLVEEKVGKHNNFEARILSLEEHMKVANHRIDDLEALHERS